MSDVDPIPIIMTAVALPGVTAGLLIILLSRLLPSRLADLRRGIVIILPMLAVVASFLAVNGLPGVPVERWHMSVTIVIVTALVAVVGVIAARPMATFAVVIAIAIAAPVMLDPPGLNAPGILGRLALGVAIPVVWAGLAVGGRHRSCITMMTAAVACLASTGVLYTMGQGTLSVIMMAMTVVLTIVALDPHGPAIDARTPLLWLVPVATLVALGVTGWWWQPGADWRSGGGLILAAVAMTSPGIIPVIGRTPRLARWSGTIVLLLALLCGVAAVLVSSRPTTL